MKFSLSNLLLFFLIVALCLGWWIDHRELSTRLNQAVNRTDSVTTGAIYQAARQSYYQAVSTKLIANEQLAQINEEDLVYAFMNLYRHQNDVETYLSYKGEPENADILPAKILLTLECETADDFIAKLNKYYPRWLPAIEDSTEGSGCLIKRVDSLLSNVPESALKELITDRLSLQRGPW